MSRHLSLRPTYANVMATIAVFIALGGSSYAALRLETNSIRSRHIANGQVRRSDLARDAVTSASVRDGSLQPVDFQPGSLPGGAKGETGPRGPEGPAGQQGPSGVVKTLHFEAQFSPQNLPGNNGNTYITPASCRTATYTAGPGEQALVSYNMTASPSAPVTDVLYVTSMVSQDGGTFVSTAEGYVDNAESLQDGTAHATANDVVPLTAGKTYKFGAAASSNAPVSLSPGYCVGTVTIVHG